MKKRIFNVIVFFMINYFIFNCMFIESIKNNLLFFTIIYVIISIIMYLKTKNTIKKLNEQLRKSRERGKTNEK